MLGMTERHIEHPFDALRAASAKRRAAMLKLRSRGMSLAAIGLRFEITRQRVAQILKTAPPEG
jgi:DNA-directed RNA polymerase sigma subunit (sigma70/sigma32)